LGIVGLSRGWLVSGAENVLGTLWPVEDLAGPFFAEYYSRLAALPYGSRSISTALRETQIRMMRRQDRYAAPRYWAAYALLQRS
jgi:CHAT domain-containing protein